jgi:AcrR family transcriptional regulator
MKSVTLMTDAESPGTPNPNRERTARRPGRPRDPLLEARVFDAAIEIYAGGGWHAFNFGAIARAAGVGKAALYKRWPSRGELLRETLASRWYVVEAINTGSLRGDLTELAQVSFDAYAGRYGGVALQLRADLQSLAEVRAATRSHWFALIKHTREIVRRAIDGGQLPAQTSPALIADIIVGAIANRVAATPRRLRGTMLTQRNKIIEDLVELVLRGAGARKGSARKQSTGRDKDDQ